MQHDRTFTTWKMESGGEMDDMTIEGDTSCSNRESHGGFDIAEITTKARELAEKAREWVTENPLGALGIAVGTGFLFGRAMRMWVLR